MSEREEHTVPDETEATQPRSAADSLRRGSARRVAAPATAEPVPAQPAGERPAAATAADEPTTAYEPVGDRAADDRAASDPPAPRHLAVPLLAGFAVLLALVVTLATLNVSNHRAEAQARTDALAAAKKAATAILSASYRTVDNDIAAARKLLTPRFQQDYDKIAKATFRQQVVDNQAIITAQVQGGGVKLASRDKVVVLLFVNQLSTNNKRPVPRLDQPRVRMTLVLRHGAWLVDRMDAI